MRLLSITVIMMVNLPSSMNKECSTFPLSDCLSSILPPFAPPYPSPPSTLCWLFLLTSDGFCPLLPLLRVNAHPTTTIFDSTLNPHKICNRIQILLTWVKGRNYTIVLIRIRILKKKKIIIKEMDDAIILKADVRCLLSSQQWPSKVTWGYEIRERANWDSHKISRPQERVVLGEGHLYYEVEMMVNTLNTWRENLRQAG